MLHVPHTRARIRSQPHSRRHRQTNKLNNMCLSVHFHYILILNMQFLDRSWCVNHLSPLEMLPSIIPFYGFQSWLTGSESEADTYGKREGERKGIVQQSHSLPEHWLLSSVRIPWSSLRVMAATAVCKAVRPECRICICTISRRRVVNEHFNRQLARNQSPFHIRLINWNDISRYQMKPPLCIHSCISKSVAIRLWRLVDRRERSANGYHTRTSSSLGNSAMHSASSWCHKRK